MKTALARSCGVCVLGLLAVAPAAWSAAPAVTTLGSYASGPAAPTRVAARASGISYSVDPTAGLIITRDAFGRVIETRGGFDTPLAVAVDPSDRLLVSEMGPRRVSAFDAEWQLLFTLGGGDGEFASPGFIAVDPTPGHDTVYVSDGAANRVGVYSHGNLDFFFGSAGSGAGQFSFPAGVCATTNEIFVVDQNNDRVQVFNHAGAFLRQFTLVTTNASGALGGRSQDIAADSSGRLYVADAFQGMVRVFSPTGELLTVIGSLGDAPGQLRSPAGLAVDPCGRLLVASPNNGRVELFGLDGFIHLTASPADRTLASGSNLTLSVLAGGAGPFTYQWRRGTNDLVDGGAVSGATNATLILGSLAPGDSGNYSVVVTGPSGPLPPCGAAEVAVLTAPSIITGPAGLTVARGSNASFSVTAAGDALTYQWLHDGAPLAGATNATLALMSAQPEDGGGYAVTVRNAVGEATSDPAALAVLTPPAILLQPTDQKVVQGNTAVFGVAADGDQLSFAWKYNGGPLPMPDDPTMAMANVQPPAAGLYSVVVTNPVGAATSDVAQLSVFIPPGTQLVTAIDVQPDLTVHIQMAGDAGYTFGLDASTDLQEWLRLTNLTSQSGLFDYVDIDAANTTNRFYRLRWRP